MSKLFETINNLENYVLEDKSEEITIEKVHIIADRPDIELVLSNLPDKSLKLFYTDSTVIGYLYFEDLDYRTMLDNFFKYYDDDCNSDKIGLIIVKYTNGEEFLCNVYWNSLFYKLNEEHYILLFLGREDLV